LAFAQLYNADATLLHTQPARTIKKGQLSLSSNMNFYTKVGDFIGSSKPIDFETVNYWLVAGNTVVGYGIHDNYDVHVGLRVYQDTHQENEFNLPDDIFITFRAGNFKFGQNYFRQAFMLSTRIPVGKVHNYPFAEYASGAFEYGLMYAASFYLDPYLPYRSYNMHLNMGWWNHNELGQKYEFSDGQNLKATVNSNDFRLALASVFPTPLFDFRVELSGILYLEKPNNFIYSAEEFAVLSPSLRFKPLDNLSIDLGSDFLISPEREWTTAQIPIPSTALDLPASYPKWKIYMGANYAFRLGGFGGKSEIEYEQSEAQQRIDSFETIVKEREKAETIQEELENLKKIRKEAEEEIEELKKILDE